MIKKYEMSLDENKLYNGYATIIINKCEYQLIPIPIMRT